VAAQVDHGGQAVSAQARHRSWRVELVQTLDARRGSETGQPPRPSRIATEMPQPAPAALEPDRRPRRPSASTPRIAFSARPKNAPAWSNSGKGVIGPRSRASPRVQSLSSPTRYPISWRGGVIALRFLTPGCEPGMKDRQSFFAGRGCVRSITVQVSRRMPQRRVRIAAHALHLRPRTR
jgi:hypothetical protein